MINDTTATAITILILNNEGLSEYTFRSLALRPLLTNSYLLFILAFKTGK